MKVAENTEGTRGRILRAAAREFARKGFDGVSLACIAEDVGIKAASIFHHFPDGKQQLYAEILRTITETLGRQLVVGLRKAGDPVSLMLELSEQAWDFAAEHPEFASLVLRESLDPASGRIHEFHFNNAVFTSLARDYIQAAQARDELGRFDPDTLFFMSQIRAVGFHGAPGLRANLWQDRTEQEARQWAKERFLEDIRRYVAP